MRLPKKITPCPVIEAIIELRFESSLPPDAIFGMVYGHFKDEYPKTENLPIIQIPEPIRLNDPNLRHRPYHRISNQEFIIQIGPRVMAFSSPNEYVGWKKFSEKAKETFGKIIDLKIPTALSRLGIRYINFFDSDIFQDITPAINLDSTQFKTKDRFFRSNVLTGDFLSTLQISNSAEITKAGALKKGSIIDIDSFIESCIVLDINKINGLLEKGHEAEKSLFFSLLKSDFLKKFNPEYDG